MAKFLGIIFDNKHSFIPHIESLKVTCLKALDLLKVVSNSNWGGGEETLLHLYRSLIRSKLDYGSIVFGSARPSYMKMLNTIHHQGLRLCLGAFRTSPVESLYVEANEPSLEDRRIKLALQYITKLKSNPSNPAHNCVFHPNYTQLYSSKCNAIPPLGIRIQQHVKDADIDLSVISKHSLLSTPPWQLIKPNVNLQLTKHKKSNTNQLTFQQEFNELRDQFSDYKAIYTDGSKDGFTVAAAAVTPSKTLASRLHDGSSVFTAEAKAIHLALNTLESQAIKSILYFLTLYPAFRESKISKVIIQ